MGHLMLEGPGWPHDCPRGFSGGGRERVSPGEMAKWEGAKAQRTHHQPQGQRTL